MTIKVGVVGLSKQGCKHIDAILAHPLFSLGGVCDVDHRVSDCITSRIGCPVFEDFATMLRCVKDLEALILCLPHHEYGDIIPQAFTRGIHVLKEKPLARSLSEAQEWLRLAHTTHTHLGIAAQRRFHAPYRLAREHLNSLGNIYSVRAVHCDSLLSSSQTWRNSKHFAGGGVILDMGYHVLDLLAWYLGCPDGVHHCFTCSGGRRVEPTMVIEDTASIALAFGESCHCQIFLSRESAPPDELIVINGSEGHVVVSRTSFLRFSRQGQLLDSVLFDPSWRAAMNLQLDDFCGLIISDGATPSWTEASTHLATMRLIDKVYNFRQDDLG